MSTRLTVDPEFELVLGPACDVHANVAIVEILARRLEAREGFAKADVKVRPLRGLGEGTGTLLDNSLVFWGNELGRGNTHSHSSLPYVLAGSAGGALRTGRFVQYGKGVTNNNFLVSLMNLMDVPGTTFGDPKYCTGPASL